MTLWPLTLQIKLWYVYVLGTALVLLYFKIGVFLHTFCLPYDMDFDPVTLDI